MFRREGSTVASPTIIAPASALPSRRGNYGPDSRAHSRTIPSSPSTRRKAARTRLMARTALVGLLALGVVAASGCSKKVVTALPPPFIGREVPPELVAPVRKMGREGERNWVLNLNQTAIAALRIGDIETARAALDEAILQIEAIYGNSPEASKARMLFYTEDVKLFKGDPYERSMTYFYRGILADLF